MNTLNNKIYIPEKYTVATLSDTMIDAKDKGFTMILLQDKVYSIQTYFEANQSNNYFLEYYALFDFKLLQETPPIIKFNKSFDTLYSISMKMADECIGSKKPSQRFEKLEEEYHELIEAFAQWNNGQDLSASENLDLLEKIIDEMGDVLFVLLHCAHRIIPGTTAFTLLHAASSKMLSRMNDSNYTAKN